LGLYSDQRPTVRQPSGKQGYRQQIEQADLVHTRSAIRTEKVIHILADEYPQGTRGRMQLRSVDYDEIVGLFDRTGQRKTKRATIEEFDVGTIAVQLLHSAHGMNASTFIAEQRVSQAEDQRFFCHFPPHRCRPAALA